MDRSKYIMVGTSTIIRMSADELEGDIWWISENGLEVKVDSFYFDNGSGDMYLIYQIFNYRHQHKIDAFDLFLIPKD